MIHANDSRPQARRADARLNAGSGDQPSASLTFASILLLLLSVYLPTPNMAAQIVFTDDDFDSADWTAGIVSQSAPQASFQANRIASGGSPGAYRRTDHTYAGPGDLIVAHWSISALYAPALQGEISGIDVSFDLMLLDGGDPLVVAYGLILGQGDSVYRAAYSLTTIEPITGVWEQHGFLNLQATDFIKISGSVALPDFSTGAAAMQFGYFTANGTSSPDQTTTISGIDNWSITVNHSAAAAPVSATVWLLALPLLGLLRLRHS